MAGIININSSNISSVIIIKDNTFGNFDALLNYSQYPSVKFFNSTSESRSVIFLAFNFKRIFNNPDAPFLI